MEEIVLHVGSSYDAVGDALKKGTVDFAVIPQSLYIKYQQDCTPVLNVQNGQPSKIFENPKEWNDGQPTQNTTQMTQIHQGLILAGSSEKGRQIAEKVNQGQKITFEEWKELNWTVLHKASPAGYISPILWLYRNYQKTIADLSNVVTVDTYEKALMCLASRRADVVCIYGGCKSILSKRMERKQQKWKFDLG